MKIAQALAYGIIPILIGASLPILLIFNFPWEAILAFGLASICLLSVLAWLEISDENNRTRDILSKRYGETND